MNTSIVTLAKREFWEHRALWLVPVAAAGFFVVSAVFGGLHISNDGFDFNIRPGAMGADPRVAGYVGAMSLMMIAAFLSLFSGLTVFSYLLDSLFAERKDRSILFWKSLPVSDARTVAAKLLVAMLVVPVVVLALAVIVQPLMAGIAWLRFPELRPFFGGFVGGMSALPYLVIAGVFGLLWYLPVATYLLLASVLAKRTPIMYAAIPPLALSIAEKLLLDTGYVNRFVAERMFPWPTRMQHLFVDAAPHWKAVGGDWWVLFQDPKLWLGLVAAAGMMYMVVRLRRYRDET